MIEERGIDAGFWRAVGPGYTKFAIETLIDEVARGVKADPLTYRMDLLQKHPRGQAVLKAVGEMSQWGKAKLPKGHALGLAYSDAWNTYCGMVVQVSIEKGRPKVHKVWSAVDCGHALQPQNIQAQIEGSVIFGLSAALHERMDFRAGEPMQTNLNTYQPEHLPSVTRQRNARSVCEGHAHRQPPRWHWRSGPAPVGARHGQRDRLAQRQALARFAFPDGLSQPSAGPRQSGSSDRLAPHGVPNLKRGSRPRSA
jgi:hypothetical protein